MFDQLDDLLATRDWLVNLILIALFYTTALIMHRMARLFARYIVRLSCITPKGRDLRPERRETLRAMIGSGISFFAFITATIASVGRFVPIDTLVWILGLFSAAFSLSARPIISDVMSGIGLIFEDSFAVGEKVEILGLEGIVEAMNLRTTWLRSPTGELYILPNGEIRVVRNFSRGRFSMTKITLKIAASDLNQALIILQELGGEAVVLLPNLLEPWQVLSKSGVIGQQTELTLLAKTRFGQAADMRPRLLALIQERMAENDISLAS